MKKTALRLLTLLLACLPLAGCAAGGSSTAAALPTQTPAAESQSEASPASATQEVFAMDTYMTITCYGGQCEQAAQAAVAEIERLDALLSVGQPTSEISRLNAAGSGTVSADTAAMLEQALALYQSTGGAFDLSIYPVMQLWGFTTGSFAVPTQAQLDALLPQVDSSRITLDRAAGQVALGAGQGIDLGGIAKGYTSDRIMALFADYGLTAGLVSLGGNVQFYGSKADGSPWRCGIQDPFLPQEQGAYLGVLSTTDKAVITSGPYERYFVDEATGTRYHHIIDPATGYPAQSGLASVTVVSSQGMLADGLSTACFVLGLEGAAALWRASPQDFDLILMTEEGQVYITQGLEQSFESSYPVQVLTREEGEVDG